jgi:hypothetical protein
MMGPVSFIYPPPPPPPHKTTNIKRLGRFLSGHPGVVHGGTLAALLDNTFGVAFFGAKVFFSSFRYYVYICVFFVLFFS